MTPREWKKKSLKLMKEKSLLKETIRAAKLFGWMVYHSYDSRLDSWKKGIDVGFPDLILVREKTMIALELKREGKKPTKFQYKWLHAFRQVEHISALYLEPHEFGDLVDMLGKTDN